MEEENLEEETENQEETINLQDQTTELPQELIDALNNLTFSTIYSTIDIIQPILNDDPRFYSAFSDAIIQRSVNKHQFSLLYSQFLQGLDDKYLFSEIRRQACILFTQYILSTDNSRNNYIRSTGISKLIGSFLHSNIIDLRSGRLLLQSLVSRYNSAKSDRLIRMLEVIIDNAGSTFAISITDELWDQINALKPYEVQLDEEKSLLPENK